MRSIGAWVAVAVALTVVATVVILVAGFWGDIGASRMSLAGWLAMGLGIVLTLALGIGLMALVFISSRSGWDEPPRSDR